MDLQRLANPGREDLASQVLCCGALNSQGGLQNPRVLVYVAAESPVFSVSGCRIAGF
jgi:hypothetical protein